MKYLGIDKDGETYLYRYKPVWSTYRSQWDDKKGSWIILPSIAKALLTKDIKPCCLYKIEGEFFSLVEDRR